MQRQGFRRRGDHGDPDTHVGLGAEAKRAQRQDPPVGLPEDLESGVRQGVGHDADLHADRLLRHQRCEMFGLGHRAGPALAESNVR